MGITICGYKLSREAIIAGLFFVLLFFIVIVSYCASGNSSSSSTPNTTPKTPSTTQKIPSTTQKPAITTLIAPDTQSGCEIDATIPDAPLLLITGTANFSYPNHGDTVIKSEKDATIDFACPGSKIVIGDAIFKEIVTASCVSDQQFQINNGKYRWSDVSCQNQVKASTKKVGQKCERNGEVIWIGFGLEDGRFVVVVSVCFDAALEVAIYSQFEIPSSINTATLIKDKPLFYQDNEYYSITKLNSYYVRTKQRTTINALLGLDATSKKYIQDNDYFLSKGHLAARADFFYVAQQNATYRFLNAAPQWQSLNGFNWNQAEINTRQFAIKNKVNLQVWTGIYGTATLPHSTTNTPINLYIYTDNKRLVPVPAFFWRMVYNSANEKGIVLVSFNNPYLDVADMKKEIFCDDVSGKVDWLTWDKDNPDGYSFACTLTQFQKTVNDAPKLIDRGILT